VAWLQATTCSVSKENCRGGNTALFAYKRSRLASGLAAITPMLKTALIHATFKPRMLI
jgi:hypothetical protein